MISVAVRKVVDGQGLDTYRTFWLVEFNWIGFLVLVVAAFVAVFVGMLFAWRENRLWRDLERKYDGTKDA
jgi:hypothetical protein